MTMSIVEILYETILVNLYDIFIIAVDTFTLSIKLCKVDFCMTLSGHFYNNVGTMLLLLSTKI